MKKSGLTAEQIDERYKIITEFENKIPSPIDYESIVGTKLWNEYKERRIKLLDALNENQKFCDKLSEIVTKSIK